ncbi:MAG: triose-phosphate isomerase [Chloroflexi bacterium]|nr:triose-phosphate isomerase [Chloroflexota bacterium]
MASPFVVGNWKMNTTVAEATQLAREIRGAIADVSGVTRVVCPPSVSLAAVRAELDGVDIGVGAQNMHPEAKGAFTGEISAAMLADLCRYVILGHSERRALFGEQDDFINAKVRAALGAGLTPILCVGETLDERETEQANAVVQRQLRGGLASMSASDVAKTVVAYEPVWAIGTGRAATPDDAQAIIGMIRVELGRLASDAVASNVPLLYGGSVNAGNCADIAAQRDIDGALVGGASLVASDFAVIVKAFAVRA